MKLKASKTTPIASLQGPFVSIEDITTQQQSCSVYDPAVPEDAPSVTDSEVSSLSGYESDDLFLTSTSSKVQPREPLQWEFMGLTLWLEYQEFDKDLTRAIDHAVKIYGTERIPMAHSTAIYGMSHLSPNQARTKLAEIPSILVNGQWPKMEAPVGVTQDIAQEGRPGQVCSIAWAELTLKTNDMHEQALDQLYALFDVPTLRKGPWTPHVSLAYDNPVESVLNLQDTMAYVASHPTLMRAREVKAISLWDTTGKMGNWQCLDRVSFRNNNECD